jgi:hypothetical protein
MNKNPIQSDRVFLYPIQSDRIFFCPVLNPTLNDNIILIPCSQYNRRKCVHKMNNKPEI